MQMDWSTENGIVTLIYPGDLTDIDIDDVERLLDLSIRGMRRRASAIEARRAATLGAVHESAVGKAETP
jgi:2-phospho-L-lactate guanylyltransferase (CobY/MobA/RfbA family)